MISSEDKSKYYGTGENFPDYCSEMSVCSAVSPEVAQDFMYCTSISGLLSSQVHLNGPLLEN